MNHRCKRLAARSSVIVLGLCASAAGASVASAVAAVSPTTVTISPLAGSSAAMPGTQVSFLGASARSLSAITVVGSASGKHSGRLRSYSSATGASFLPGKPFTPGEQVTVHARWSVAKRKTRSLSTHFTVAQPGTVPITEFPSVPGTPADVQSFQSRPDLRPPSVTVRQPAAAGVAPGYVLASPFLGPGQYGPMIFDNAGNLVWFRSVAAGQDATDFRTQTYRGKPALTWWQGRTLQFGFGVGEDVIANANYKTVAVVRAGNGLQADEHEFTLTPEGSAYVLAYSPVQTSLASAGGPAGGLALDGVIQRIDIHTGLVMWEWHSIGHVDVSESYSKLPGLATNAYDYFHVNSLEPLKGGNFLISARNTWGLYELSGHSGAVLWRLGGKKSTFALGAGVPFAFQHDARMLPNGEISLFDDEGAPIVKPPTRGEIVKLDTKAKTATLAGQLVRTSGPLVTGSQGNAQSLSGGGWMVGWGGLPNLTEFNAAGQIVYDAQLPRGENSYRVYREQWSGQPSEPPALAARTTGATTAVYASWNGATTVASWQLLTGPSASQLSPVSTTPKGGFETAVQAPAAPFVQVRALSATGRVLGTSKAVQPTSG